jgi:predicted  nucleic acid-binding Zn-ribbon protein
MPDENNNNQAPATPPVVPDPKGTDPKQPENGAQQPIDLKSLPADQLAQVLENPNLWKLDRIKDIQEKAKKAADFEAQEAKRAEDELKKKGEFEKLNEQKDQKITELQTQLQTQTINNILTIEASKAGAVDVNAVLKLIDRSGIQIAEDGTVSGASEAVTKLFETSPYLKGSGTTPSIGDASNPNDQNQGVRRFTLTQVKDPIFYRANEKEIDKAMMLGLIVDDTAATTV